MKKSILFISNAAIIALCSCSNEPKQNMEPVKNGQSKPTHKKDADSLGMKMGGNELDSKKK